MLGRSMSWGSSGGLVLLLAVLAVPAAATLRYGPMQFSGSIDSQWWVRHPDVEKFEFVQNRNTALLRLDYDWLQRGRLIDRYNIPFVERSKLYLLYRGVYDSFYDIAPGGRQNGVAHFDDIVGGPIDGNGIGEVNADGSLKSGLYSRLSEGNRDDKRFENVLREAYIDLKVKGAPLSFRLGRQQVIWGESDHFRLMDIINPLDLTWHLQQTEWDKIREPLWLMKGIWDIGQVGPLSQAFVEAVYNPGDYVPGAMVDWLPNPWSVGINDPLRAGQIQMPSTGASNPQGLYLTPIFDLQGTNFRHGDFNRNPKDASEGGLRFHAVTPQGFEFTTNYFYGRGRGIGASAGSPFNVDIQEIRIPTKTTVPNARFPGLFQGELVFPALVRAEVKHPYSHIFGLTGNYFDGTLTNTVYRFETAYQIGAPFSTQDETKRVKVKGYSCIGGSAPGKVCWTDADCGDGGACEVDPADDPVSSRTQIAPLGATKRDVWAGMIGFDRPTWIRWLNNKTTWFLTGQFFFSYVNGAHSNLRGGVLTASRDPYFTPENKPGQPPVFPSSLTDDGVGTWSSGPYAGQVERTQNADYSNGAAKSNEDNVRQWELLTSFAATSFYLGGTFVPFVAMAFDPVNLNYLLLTKFDYFITNDLIFQVSQHWYTNFGARTPSLDPWGAGGLNARRDETGVKLTYQF